MNSQPTPLDAGPSTPPRVDRGHGAHRRALVCALVCLALVALVACGSRNPITGPSSPRVALHREIAVPPGVESTLVETLDDEAMLKARTPLEEVWANLSVPPELAAVPGETTDAAPEPPLAAQQAYVDGQSAWLRGERAESIAQLEQALRLSPTSAPLLRFLSEVYLSANNPIRGEQYLADAVKHDRTHAPSLFQLGRLALERGEWERGVVFVHATLQHAGRRDTGMQKLGGYYIAVGLERVGYLRAASKQYRAFFAHPGRLRGTKGTMNELALLAHQDRLTWRNLGDLHSRLGELPQALLAYKAALTSGGALSDADLHARMVYAQLRLGEASQAVENVLERVRLTHGSAVDLQMVRYLAEQGVNAAWLAEALRKIYEADPQADPARLAIATAELFEPAQAEDFLQRHLAEHPGDANVFAVLIEHSLRGPGEPRYTQAIVQAARFMQQHPQHAEMYGLTFLRIASDRVALRDAFDELKPTQRNLADVQILEGLVLAGLGDVEGSEAAFTQALALSPESVVARLQLAKVMVVRGEFDRASELLEAIEQVDDPSVVALRVRVLSETGRADEALALIDQTLEDGEPELTLIIQKARLLLALGRAEEAERTLLDTLNLRPTEESLYEVLFRIYDARDQAGRALIEDADTQYRRLMRRMLGVIPDSRIGKLKRAELHAAGRQYGEAATLLKSLVRQNPRDLPALKQLLDVLVEAGSTDQAVQLMQNVVDEFPRDPEVLRAAVAFFSKVSDHERVATVQELLYNLLPEGDAKLFGLVALYFTTDRSEEALQLLTTALDEARTQDPARLIGLLIAVRTEMGQPDAIDGDFIRAIEKFPDHEPDLRYRWATVRRLSGDEAGYVETLVETHHKFPDHAPTNNDLGYLWVEQHEHLDAALEMIKRAVEAEPDNAAYLDSLGWAYYKLGRFDEAVAMLRKSVKQAVADYSSNRSINALATRAVVLDHLGDALYRQGSAAEANAIWQRAKRVLSNLQIEGDAELERVRQNLGAKIEAHKKQLPVPLAPLPQEGPAAALQAPVRVG